MDIAEFNKSRLREIASSGRCQGCPLLGRTRVGMDSLDNEAGESAILFMGLNPGREEALRGLPFVGKAGRFLRQCMSEAGYEGTGWAMLNSILCSTNNESEIPDVEACQRRCRENTGGYVRIIKPRVIAPCGNGASALFGLGRGITANARLLFVSRGRTGKARPTVILPIVHPSSLIRNGGKLAPGYGDFISRLRQILKVARVFDPYAPGFNLGSHQMLFGL